MPSKTIWFDLVNSPHVLVLEPLIREMERRGTSVIVTAKDFSQTFGLLEQKGMPFTGIGRHGGGSTIGKALALASRVAQLIVFAARRKIDITVCHGSRELIITSKLLSIPNVTMFDYEYTEHYIKNWGASLMMIPDIVPAQRLRALGYRMKNIYQYPGLKEHIYLNPPAHERDYLKNLGVEPQEVLVVFRPPSTESHYHDARSEALIKPLLEYLDRPGVKVVILPRHRSQLSEVQKWKTAMKYAPIIPEKPVDGPKLLAHADAVISGGGTMVREAAVLGTPAYSIFWGKLGSIDEWLMHKNLLLLIRNNSDFPLIRLEKNSKVEVGHWNAHLPQLICDKILSVL